jgi:hypothetical protein
VIVHRSTLATLGILAILTQRCDVAAFVSAALLLYCTTWRG